MFRRCSLGMKGANRILSWSVKLSPTKENRGGRIAVLLYCDCFPRLFHARVTQHFGTCRKV
jgi:hypothetical protein